MAFGVLGPLTVWRAGVPLELGTPKGRILLAVLMSRPGRPVSDDALVEAVWGEEQPKSAAKNVQTYVHRLRHRLGDPGRIARERRGYVLRADRAEVDAARFEDLTDAARTALAAGERERSRRLFAEALGLWRGPRSPGSPICRRWARGPRASMNSGSVWSRSGSTSICGSAGTASFSAS